MKPTKRDYLINGIISFVLIMIAIVMLLPYCYFVRLSDRHDKFKFHPMAQTPDIKCVQIYFSNGYNNTRTQGQHFYNSNGNLAEYDSFSYYSIFSCL